MILRDSFGLTSSVVFHQTPQHQEDELHDTRSTRPQTTSPRYTTDDGMTGENCDTSENSLQDYDDGGDNSTYLEVQPMDNSGESSGEQGNDEESVHYDSDENLHPREHPRREEGGRAARHYHDDDNSQWFLHYPGPLPRGMACGETS